ncbi:MAG: hypothetical protein ACI31S_00275 [Bacilli bacterium]
MIKEYLLKIGYKEKDYKKIMSTPGVKDLTDEVLLYNICWNFVSLLSLGYPRRSVIKMTKKLSQLFGITYSNIENRFNDLVNLGYSKDSVRKMTTTLPQLYSISMEDNILHKIDDLKKLGYTYDEIIAMTKLLPQLYSFSINCIKEKIRNLKKLGYDEETVLFLTKELPAIYSMSIENITDKINLLRDINLEFVILSEPKQLIQSSKLTYARFAFFRDKNITINEDNYKRLFYDSKAFKKSFGISNDEILKLYHYEEYLQERKKKNGGTL